jgi:hypothetical protein
VGYLVPHYGPAPSVALLLGAGALAAALASNYAALALLIVLILVPLGSSGPLPDWINDIDAVYGAALIGLALRAAASGRALVLGGAGLALAGFLLAGLSALAAGVLGAGDGTAALGHFRGLFGYALVPVLVLALADGQGMRRRTLLWLLCAVAAVTAARGVLSWAELNGLVQLGGPLHRFAAPDGDELVGAVPSLTGTGGYLRAWAGNFEGNSLGAFLVLLLPVMSYLALQGRNAPARLVAAPLTVLLLVALVVTYSRGAYLGLAAAALPLLAGMWRRSPVSALLLVAAGAAAVLLLVDHLPGADDRVATLRALGEDPTVQHRQIVYQQVFDAFRRDPLWGIGLGTSVGEIGTGADSLYLFLLVRGGLLATAAAIALVWVAVRQVLSALRAGRLTGLDIAVGAGVFGFAVHSTVDYTLWNPKVALTFWLMAGFLTAAACSKNDAASAAREGAS